MNRLLNYFKRKFISHNLFYWHGEKNAGDDFNIDILEYYGIKFKESTLNNATLIGIGSILENIIVPKDNRFLNKYNDPPINIMGSGFIQKRHGEEMTIRKAHVIAVRGTLSLDRLKQIDGISFEKNYVLADPGIMASHIYKKISNGEDIVGIVPHYIDKGSEFLKNIKIKLNYKFINIQDSPKKVCYEISKCSFIFSSSLHGLIFADSYNIPNFHILLSDNVIGGDYKIRDYYSGLDLEYPGHIDLRNTVLDNSIIKKLKDNYQVKPEIVASKQEKLERCYNQLGALHK